VRIIQSRWRGIADASDLAQLALEELLAALPTFRFASRFSTWAFTVIVRRVARAQRGERAAKRAAIVEPLTEQLAIGKGLVAPMEVEATAEARVLAALSAEVLARRADERLARIFHLWAVEDKRLAQIGHAMGLSSARVSTLVEQARTILRDDPAIRAWLDTPDDTPGDHSST
jgi:RNA polymerase sigma factor (sigma-70 family)